VKDIVNSIEEKLHKFIAKYKQLYEEKEKIEQEYNKLSDKLDGYENEMTSLQEKVRLMKISKSVDTSQEDAKSTKLKINEYIREIDKCIALLNK
tara:strand:- start:530 stop:811 length:282 start_codon:yes stop_codon:yes gene_type:complete